MERVAQLIADLTPMPLDAATRIAAGLVKARAGLVVLLQELEPGTVEADYVVDAIRGFDLAVRGDYGEAVMQAVNLAGREAARTRNV